MPQTPDTIHRYFIRLGLSTEVADLYVALRLNSPQTISELSRSSLVERTRIYRLLEQMQSLDLVEIESKYKHSLVKAAPLANLQILINQKRDEIQELQADLSDIQDMLAPNPTSSPTTSVQYYKGPQGLRQMLWNELRSTSEVMSYSYQIFDEGVGRAFMKNWVAEFERHALHKKIVFNESYVKSWHNRPGNRIKGMEYHYIDPSILAIGHTCNVYDDITAYFSWKGGEVFGVEIYNRSVASAQRQLLTQVWSKSTPETRF